MVATGTPEFDGITLTTIEVDMITRSLVAKAAFVNTKTGATHGWTEGTGTIWSAETKAAVAALAASMEKDLAVLHFGGTRESTGFSSAATSGLGEHLADGDPTSSI